MNCIQSQILTLKHKTRRFTAIKKKVCFCTFLWKESEQRTFDLKIDTFFK